MAKAEKWWVVSSRLGLMFTRTVARNEEDAKSNFMAQRSYNRWVDCHNRGYRAIQVSVTPLTKRRTPHA